MISIENFSLGQPIKETDNLSELSKEEYYEFEIVGFNRMLPDEKIFKANPLIYGSVNWDLVLISSTDEKIYKISLQSIFENNKDIKSKFKEVLNLFKAKFGNYSEHKLFSKKYIWDKENYNIILNFINNRQINCINLLFTADFYGKRVLEHLSTKYAENNSEF